MKEDTMIKKTYTSPESLVKLEKFDAPAHEEAGE